MSTDLVQYDIKQVKQALTYCEVLTSKSSKYP